MKFILIFAALVVFIKLILKKERLKYQNLQYEALQDYTAKTEALYNSMREFKHEYLNKLLTMYFYIYDGNVDELKKYYEKVILPTKKQLARPGYSTRGESRGMGLYIAKNLLDKCPAIIHNTYMRDNIFYQVLRIER